MGRAQMEFTGERVVPHKTPGDIYKEHIDRYIFAAGFTGDRDVLDVACGAGYGAAHMLAAGARSVTGVDVSREAVVYARDWYGGSGAVSFVRGDGARLPFRDRAFDTVVSFETLEHIRAYRRFLSECRRVLKEGGLLICSTPNKRIFSPGVPRPPNPYHFREFWAEEYRRLVNRFFDTVTLYGQCDVTLADNSVDRERGVGDFRDDDLVSSAYMIAVAVRKG